MEELLGTSIVLPWLVPPAPMMVAMAIAACTLLLSVFAPTLHFYARRLLVELTILRMQLGLFGLTDGGAITSWPWVQQELRQLLRLEANRRMHPLRMARAAQKAASARPAPMMAAASAGMVFKDLVLVGGGHSHAHVLKMFGMHPEPGVQLTLITRDVDTPYSGMLPGYVAGAYTWRDAHIDLAKLASFANARLVHAEACGLDTERKQVLLTGRPPISYDVLSIDIGSAPKPVSFRTDGEHKAATRSQPASEEGAISGVLAVVGAVAGVGVAAVDVAAAAVDAATKIATESPIGVHMTSGVRRLSGGRMPPPSPGSLARPASSARPVSAITPVKPIDGFCRRWDDILARVLALPAGSVARIVVVGGGAGGVELTLSMQARLSRELARVGRDPSSQLSVTLVGRSAELMPQHSRGVRAIFSRIFADRGLTALLGTTIAYATPTELHTTDGRAIPYDEAIWCTQGGAQDWLRSTSLALDAGGFIAVHPTLESTNTPDVFACGDVAAVLEHPRPKAGVFAVRQGPPLTDNLRHRLRGEPTLPFTPQSTFLGLIGAGDGQCVASRGRMALEGRWLWNLKDWIDRTWMHGYQDGLRGTMGGGSMGGDMASEPPSKVAMAAGSEALEKLAHASMRCGGCGAKVGVSVLSRVMERLREGNHLPPDPPDVLLGLDAPDDCAVLAPSKLASVHTVDFFRSLIDDPYTFGRVAANHALSDCHAMNAAPTGALAVAVVPYGLDSKVEEVLFQMMAGAARALSEAGAALLGGHSCEGQDLSLGFCVTGHVPARTELRKAGLAAGQTLLLTKPLGTGTLFAAHMRGAAQGRWMAAATNSMLSSNAEAARVLAAHGARACTDVTGFGLLGHLFELASASQARVRVRMGAVPLLPGAAETVASGIFSSLQPANLRLKRAVSNEAQALQHPAYPLLFDPQTAGGLLAAVPAGQAEACLDELRAAGYPEAAAIGEVVEMLEEGVCVPALVECVE